MDEQNNNVTPEDIENTQPEQPEQPYTTPEPQYAPPEQQYAQQQPYIPVPQQPVQPQPRPGQQGGPARGKAIAAMVLGICAVAFCSIPFVGIACGVVGLILSISARKSPLVGSENGMAIAGLVCSIVGLALSVILTIIICAGTCAAINLIDNYNYYGNDWSDFFDYMQ